MDREEEQLQIITKVEKQKQGRHRYNIFLNEAYAFSVHEDILVKHRLHKGETLLLHSIEAILLDEERNLAYVKALFMVGRRPHAISEVKRKLKEKGFEAPIIDWTCKKLIANKYVNDEEFAKMWTDNRVLTQRKGRNLIRQELQYKGIDPNVVKSTMADINPEDEYEGALKIARTKWKQSSGETMDKKRKTAAFLMRRGYTGAIVSKVFAVIMSELGDEDSDLFEEFTEYD
ncbi:regulatory protein RecX [Paenibacillus roseipurpureus]|uniref:Regulatory protein RecX n=1 Tax=Paenibacillus roseopurpureus TaxID=2918901 RepID=A0AA96LSY1_9BACL|nr:RecX family transcriptional regulator [Paenibacillus sp. MBLB1832]WNR46718.1 RecX family transcriptional regulator [Paenibacillus sp. MBLB1832]